MTDLDTHSLLVAARNRLERVGWVQGEFGDCAGPRCAWGTVMVCSDWNDRLIGEAIAALGYSHPGQLAIWNDTSGRTKEEVLAAFDRAIAATSPPPPDPTFSELIEDGEKVTA